VALDTLNGATDQRAEQLIEAFEPEAPTRQLSGPLSFLATLLAVGLSAYALYWVVAIVQPQIYRVSFLLLAVARITVWAVKKMTHPSQPFVWRQGLASRET